MAEYIYIKLGDEFYEKTFMEKFKGFIIETPHKRFDIPIKQFFKILQAVEYDTFSKDIELLENDTTI